MDAIARNQIPNRPTAGMHAATGVVMNIAFANEGIGSLLKADTIAIVVGDFDILQMHLVSI